MSLKELKEKITTKQAKIGIIGLGYVGLPILVAFAKKSFSVLGFDVDERKIAQIQAGKSYIK
jgi:UDP-N-acetyl-D-glucosamine dehydrogenase